MGKKVCSGEGDNLRCVDEQVFYVVGKDKGASS